MIEHKIWEVAGTRILEIQAGGLVIKNIRDSLDLMADANYQGFDNVILHARHLHPDFFNLRTGLAGEILQKYSNYRMRLAIVGDFHALTSDSLKAFVIECNRGDQVFFVPDVDAAVSRLAKLRTTAEALPQE